jgi:hypothetical protein
MKYKKPTNWFDYVKHNNDKKKLFEKSSNIASNKYRNKLEQDEIHYLVTSDQLQESDFVCSEECNDVGMSVWHKNAKEVMVYYDRWIKQQRMFPYPLYTKHTIEYHAYEYPEFEYKTVDDLFQFAGTWIPSEIITQIVLYLPAVPYHFQLRRLNSQWCNLIYNASIYVEELNLFNTVDRVLNLKPYVDHQLSIIKLHEFFEQFCIFRNLKSLRIGVQILNSMYQLATVTRGFKTQKDDDGWWFDNSLSPYSIVKQNNRSEVIGKANYFMHVQNLTIINDGFNSIFSKNSGIIHTYTYFHYLVWDRGMHSPLYHLYLLPLILPNLKHVKAVQFNNRQLGESNMASGTTLHIQGSYCNVGRYTDMITVDSLNGGKSMIQHAYTMWKTLYVHPTSIAWNSMFPITDEGGLTKIIGQLEDTSDIILLFEICAQVGVKTNVTFNSEQDNCDLTLIHSVVASNNAIIIRYIVDKVYGGEQVLTQEGTMNLAVYALEHRQFEIAKFLFNTYPILKTIGEYDGYISSTNIQKCGVIHLLLSHENFSFSETDIFDYLFYDLNLKMDTIHPTSGNTCLHSLIMKVMSEPQTTKMIKWIRIALKEGNCAQFINNANYMGITPLSMLDLPSSHKPNRFILQKIRKLLEKSSNK